MSRKKEQIEFSVFQDFIETQKILFARTNTKMIEVNLRGNIEIYTKQADANWDSSALFWQGLQPYTALEYYNSLP